MSARPPSAASGKPPARDFAAVISDSRAALDALLKKAGVTSPYDKAGKPVIDLSALDNRALFAVASNAGGKFSDAEVDKLNEQALGEYDVAKRAKLVKDATSEA